MSSYVQKGNMATSPCFYKRRSLCSIPSRKTLNSDTKLVFTSENISTPAMQFRWLAQPISKNVSGSFLSVQNGTTGGFNIKWQLLGSNNRTIEIRKPISAWNVKTQETSDYNLNIMTMINLAREGKMRGFEEKEVWKTLLRQRWNFDILKSNSCLTESQVADVIFGIGKDLKFKYDWNLWFPEEDIAFGLELFSALHFCRGSLTKAAKLSALYEVLINHHNLATVVAATMHNIQPNAGDNIKDFTVINMWYKRLDERYNFSLGPAILPLITSQVTPLDFLDNVNEGL